MFKSIRYLAYISKKWKGIFWGKKIKGGFFSNIATFTLIYVPAILGYFLCQFESAGNHE